MRSNHPSSSPAGAGSAQLLPAARFQPSQELCNLFTAHVLKASGGTLFARFLHPPASPIPAAQLLRDAVYGASDALVLANQLPQGAEVALAGPLREQFLELVAARLSNVQASPPGAAFAQRLVAEMTGPLDHGAYQLPFSTMVLRDGVVYVRSQLPR